MKKLNRKGFTLIELLAVIVILAIVMVVTIPSVINSMNSARSGQLKNAADSVSEWLTKNYELSTFSAELGSAPDTAYTNYMKPAGGTEKTWGASDVNSLDSTVLTAAGVSNAANNIASGYAKMVGGKICVTLEAKEGGSFYVNGADSQKQTSTGCSVVSGS